LNLRQAKAALQFDLEKSTTSINQHKLFSQNKDKDNKFFKGTNIIIGNDQNENNDYYLNRIFVTNLPNSTYSTI